jgi:Na+/H+-dicarboxylate symporter
MAPSDDPGFRKPWYQPSLTGQIMIGLLVGGVLGWLLPDWGVKSYFLRDIFLNLIKVITVVNSKAHPL